MSPFAIQHRSQNLLVFNMEQVSPFVQVVQYDLTSSSEDEQQFGSNLLFSSARPHYHGTSRLLKKKNPTRTKKALTLRYPLAIRRIPPRPSQLSRTNRVNGSSSRAMSIPHQMTLFARRPRDHGLKIASRAQLVSLAQRHTP